MVEVRLYIEGGGGKGSAACKIGRQAYRKLIERAGLRAPEIVMCGGGGDAFNDFCKALKAHPSAINVLLVDAEGPVSALNAWEHLGKRPKGVEDDQAQLMVQTMETWILADPAALAAFFKGDFKPEKIPQWPSIEAIPKETLYRILSDATGGRYSKGGNSFKILALVNPETLRSTCPHARRFFEALERFDL